MAILTASVAPMTVDASFGADPGAATLSATASLAASISGSFDQGTTSGINTMSATALLTAEADTFSGMSGLSAVEFTFKLRGSIYVLNKTVPVYAPATGTVNNIEDLPTNPPDGAVYEVLGTGTNREPITAIWDTIDDVWVYQPILSGRNTTQITYLNPSIGTYLTMPNYINYNGAAHTPQYWDQSTLSDSLSYSLVDIPDPVVQAVPSSFATIWRWKVEDLADPTTTKGYSLSSWPEHNGGPSWKSKDFYRPKVKSTTKFNIKKNKTRKQKAVNFTPSSIDHMWMYIPEGLPQPFTVIFVGIIHSYPTAKFGHYLLDAGKETKVYDAAKKGKDYFFNEGATPRNVMLFQKRKAKIGVHDWITEGPYAQCKHTEKARPRMFYGVFNGSNSVIGARDTKYKFHATGPVENNGAHKYFVTGRRTNRVSDNRASHMSLWEIMIIHDALSYEQIMDIYEEMSNYYQFKEYR